MRPIRVLIADDELPARGSLSLILKKIPFIEIIGECGNGADAVRFVSEHPETDLVFLDIEMPVMNGMDAAKELRAAAPDVRIIFSTGYSEFAAEAFELDAFDYILKPYRPQRIRRAIDKLFDLQKQNALCEHALERLADPPKLTIRTNDTISVLDPAKEIVFVSKEKTGILRLYTTRGILETKTLLQDIETALLKFGFFRVHRCYLVNTSMIRTIVPWVNATYLLRMEHYEAETVPVSRHYLKDFRDRMHLTP